MRGLLADADCIGQVNLLVEMMQDPSRRELFESLDVHVYALDELGLTLDASDRAIWERCRDEELVLLTGNRNADKPDSLQNVIKEHATIESLPVITITDTYRVSHDRHYAQLAADKLLEYLFEMDNLRGARRLYIP
jgi:hypothetical protein